eukprot:RCo009289
MAHIHASTFLYIDAIFLMALLFSARAFDMSLERRLVLREEVREMFSHGFEQYMAHAFPQDELRPLSCQGWDPFGGLAVTLLDSLDTLVILGNMTAFEDAVRWAAESPSLNFSRMNFSLSVFELTIRVLGGLLSGHHFAEQLLPNYNGGLLRRAVELAEVLLIAFDTPTGLPFHEVNPVLGLNPSTRTTCPAAAGTLLLEFGHLSALTGNCKYLLAARRALDTLWQLRSSLGLWGSVIDVTTAQWMVYDADIGASTDSLYEYLFKSYVMFNDEHYLNLFEEAYSAAEQHLRKDDWYVRINHHSGGELNRLVN